MSDARHEKFLADCAAMSARAEEMHARLHAMLPEDVRVDGSRALEDPAWDDFITEHPELSC
jgi:hypothetical protein